MEALGGGIIFAIAAALWLAYLIPTWLRRGQYLASERNAVRLQQTLRILAQTAEVPTQVDVEATARAVSEQKRLLRETEALAAAESRAAADVASRLRRAESVRLIEELRRTVPAATISMSRSTLRRLRRLCALGLLGGFIGLGVGAPFALQGTGAVLLGAGVTILVSFAGILRLAKVTLARPMASARPAVSPQLFDVDQLMAADARPTLSWTPTPLPRPLYVSRGTVAATAMASIDAAMELRRAAEKSELALRAAQLQPEVKPLIPASARHGIARHESTRANATAAAQSRFARMGLIEGREDGNIDLDAALRRRRAAG